MYICLGGSHNVATKVVYFTPRSVTPFMTSINKSVGKITLRDFKSLFDRPGFFRYHVKTMDKEFGMVKEEVRNTKYYNRFTVGFLKIAKITTLRQDPVLSGPP